MKMSKKICSLLLVLCVLCTAVPAFARTEVINNGLLPESGITMENIEMVIGWQTWIKPNDDTVKAAMEDSTFITRGTVEGSFTIADQTFNFTATGFAGNSGGPYMYVTSVLGNSADLKAAMEAAKDTVVGMELKDDGTAYVTGGEGKKNLKRYFMTLLGEDYSELDDNTLSNYSVTVTATVTVKDKLAGTQEVEVGNIPEGTIYLPSASFTNDLPSSWRTYQGVYQQTSSAGDSGVDGPWAVFTAPATGTYNVWATKRDRTTSNGTTADTQADQRDIFMDVSGTKLSFVRATKEDGSYYAPTNMAYYWEPELNGTTVSLTEGQKVYVRMLSGTGNYAGSYGFVFIPTDENVQPDTLLTVSNFNVLNVGTNTTPHTGDALVSKNVTVNGAAVTATERTAFAAFPRIRQYDMDGNYLAAATVMDAIVGADAADDKFDLTTKAATLTAAGLLDGLTVTVNGAICENPDRVAVNDGDVITVEGVDKTNFAPVVFDGKITGNGSIASTDGLTLKGVADGCNAKLVTNGNAVNLSGWPAGMDITATDAFKDCYINGYITVKKDFDGEKYDSGFTEANTTGDDSQVVMFVKDYKIVHSAVKDADGRLELGVVALNTDQVTVDGATYISPNFPALGSIQYAYYLYDLSHLYITNTESAADTEVTATKTADGVYQLTTNKSVAAVLYRVAKDANGTVTGVTTEYKILDFMGDGETVTVGDNETVYVWEGSFLRDTTSASLKPLCAPLTK